MNWWERQIELGWGGPAGRPRGSADASFPLATGQRYLVTMDGGKKSHLLRADDTAWCGLTLAPADGWLIESGYDAWYWCVYDDDMSGKRWCKECSKWKAKGDLNWPERQLPQDSPVTPEEWACRLGPQLQAEASKLETMATVITQWIGHDAKLLPRSKR